MSLSPYFRSPFTDLTSGLVSHQWFGTCRDMEMKLMDCLEAYGLDRGTKKCDLLLKDFQECATRTKQYNRSWDMRWERNRQYYFGERTKQDRYGPAPNPDSY